ncbi:MULTISPECIES: glycosyltransferase family 4 protein [Microbacterium]|jgi:glycosyltransferase involved in cell wall biosynthesis|uniref:glycosyltransferase family 4 protein n=1 Tax=Microbacterium TaxID=33882 RepID=UPI001D179FF5|nr:glycosyltransferase family 4 protein [Microbacterium testaceum]MCC4248096.1 glycosyltransferase family 4 protein [Microbacterium testaceum]
MRIVSLSPVVPYDGIPHAGGQYLLRHLRALRELGHRVTVVSFDDRDNRAAAESLAGLVDVVLVPVPHPRTAAARRLVDILERQEQRVFPVRPVARRRRALRRSAAARAALAGADAVEYQWTESGWLGLRRRPAGSAPHVVVAHDVVLQSYERFLAAAGTGRHPRVLLARWRRASVRRDERRIYRHADAVLTFSAKDSALVRRIAGVGTPAVVVRPPLADGVELRPRTGDPVPTVLFVGAFDRSVNSEAALWTMADIAPLVLAVHPDARFVFAGARPTPGMRRAAAARPESFVVTGRVESVDAVYAAADVVLVPLRAGAGVKFKTVEAMVRGIPVVSTGVGIEGIVDDRIRAFAVADDARGLASGLLRALADPDAARREALRSRAAVADEFSGGAFRRSLADVYRGGRP